MYMKERILYIDMAKGFAMITIVMIHLAQYNLDGSAASIIYFFNHCFNTRLFFFLSGMVVALGGADFSRWKDAWNFGVKKTKTLLLPFIVWSALIMPYIYERSDINDFFQILIAPFLPPFNGYWFLLYLFVMQMMFLGIRIISSRLSTFVRNDFVREALVAVPFSLLLFPIYEYVLIFLFGYFFLRYGSKFLFSDIVMAVSLCIFIMLYTLNRGNREENTSLALSAIVFVVGYMRKLDVTGVSRNKVCELFCYIGRHSLEIYLLHLYLTWICRDVYISVAAIHAIPLNVIVFVVALLICVLSSYIADGIKKIPYVSFLLFGGH